MSKERFDSRKIELFKCNDLVKLLNSNQITKFINYINKDLNNSFCLTNSKYIQRVENLLAEKIKNNPELVFIIIDANCFGMEKYIKLAINSGLDTNKLFEKYFWNMQVFNTIMNIKVNYVESFLNSYLIGEEHVLHAIKKGYIPSLDVMKTYKIFDNEKIINELLEKGFMPPDEIIKSFSVFKKGLSMQNLLNKNHKPTDEEIKDFYINYPNALMKIIEKYPEKVLLIPLSSSVFTRAWLTAIKKEFLPEAEIKKYNIAGNYLLMSKVIKSKPDYIKYSQVVDNKEQMKLDSLALAMGYVPTKNEVIANEYIKKSFILMQSAINHRPEIIKYIEGRPLEGSYSLNIKQEDFYELARLAISNGYIPSPEDIEKNPRLADSFEIMKKLIERNFQQIEKCRIDSYSDRDINKLCEIALKKGYKVNKNTPSFIIKNEQVFKNDFIKSPGIIVPSYGYGANYKNNYSLELYQYFISNGFNVSNIKIAQLIKKNYNQNLIENIKDRMQSFASVNEFYNTNMPENLINNWQIDKMLDCFIMLFSSNYDVIKLMIKEAPELIASNCFLTSEFNREQIDELCQIAINNGYDPKEDDEIFGKGVESIKIMLKKFPDFIYKVKLSDGFLFNATPIPEYDEICQLAVDNGFKPNTSKMLNGQYIMFNKSYAIMKLVIETNPDLIEYCLVEDKLKYDELCKESIKKGYIPTDYAITHFGKISSNFDIMKIAVEKDYKHIFNSKLTDISELEEIINVAIKNGLDIKSLSQNRLLELFLPLPIESCKRYLNDEQLNLINNGKEFYKSNDEISNTLNPNFLSITTKEKFTNTQIEILSCYPKLQEEIIKFNLDQDNIKAKIVYNIVSNFSRNMEWISLLEKIIDNINNSNFIDLFNDLENINLSDKDYKNLLHLIISNNNLDISSYEELKNYDQCRKEYINLLIQRNTVGSLKTAYFEKLFGINLAQATELVKNYCESINENNLQDLSQEDKLLFSILLQIEEVININNLEILKKYVESVSMIETSSNLLITFESKIKKVFTDKINKSLTEPLEKNKINTEDNLDIYYAAGKDGNEQMRLMITSIGAYTGMSEPDDYYASWNMSKIASHGCCCSYVGESNLGTAEVKYCCFGFTDYEPGALLMSAPYDLCSMSTKDSYDVQSLYSPQFLFPNDILNNTRHTHNETVWERRNIDKNNQISKKQPSYIVYFVNNFEDRLNDENSKKQWESVKKAAANFAINNKPLPIMVVEREKIAKYQKLKIEQMSEVFRTTANKDLIEDIVVTFENNYAGNRKFHSDIIEKYFSQNTETGNEAINNIFNVIEDLIITNREKAYECIMELEKVILKEEKKYKNMNHGVEQALPSFNLENVLDKIKNIKTDLSNSKKSTIEILGQLNISDWQFKKTDIEKIGTKLTSEQLSSDEVLKSVLNSQNMPLIINAEKEINSSQINAGLKVHGSRHIKNVVLYSTIIGSEMLSKKQLSLLIDAAKYHDSARISEGYEMHAERSANLAATILKDRYTPSELSVILAAIEFHEVEMINQEKEFEKISNKYNLLEQDLSIAKTICKILKDADALDRTRFINDARTNPQFLNFDYSKKLIKFASEVQDTYALEDLKQYNCDEQISILLQKFTPQEILRTIRHNKNNMTLIDAQKFLDSWVKQEKIEILDMQNPINSRC